jgi:hypothetical protein
MNDDQLMVQPGGDRQMPLPPLRGATPPLPATPPMPREEMIIPRGRGAVAQRELYGALMTGFGDEEQYQLEQLMIANIARLRDDGDSYAP